MKVMIDTNVLVSAVYNPNSVPAKAVALSFENHETILSDYIINECYDVVKKRFPQHLPMLDKLLNTLVYEIVISPRAPESLISDPKDAPILNAAIINNADIIISGDKHFLELDIEYPKVFNPAEFLSKYGV